MRESIKFICYLESRFLIVKSSELFFFLYLFGQNIKSEIFTACLSHEIELDLTDDSGSILKIYLIWFDCLFVGGGEAVKFRDYGTEPKPVKASSLKCIRNYFKIITRNEIS